MVRESLNISLQIVFHCLQTNRNFLLICFGQGFQIFNSFGLEFYLILLRCVQTGFLDEVAFSRVKPFKKSGKSLRAWQIGLRIDGGDLNTCQRALAG